MTDHDADAADLERRRTLHTVQLPIDEWRLLVSVLEGVTWMHAPFQRAVSNVQVQVAHYHRRGEPT